MTLMAKYWKKPNIATEVELKLNIKMEKGEVVSKNYRIENSNIFVVGDVSTNKEKTVVGAVRSAKEAGYYIDKYLGGK